MSNLSPPPPPPHPHNERIKEVFELSCSFLLAQLDIHACTIEVYSTIAWYAYCLKKNLLIFLLVESSLHFNWIAV